MPMSMSERSPAKISMRRKMAPFQACPYREQNEPFFVERITVNQHGYGADLAETLCAEKS